MSRQNVAKVRFTRQMLALTVAFVTLTVSFAPSLIGWRVQAGRGLSNPNNIGTGGSVTVTRSNDITYAPTPGPMTNTFTYAGPPVAIPDNDSNGISVPLEVSGLTATISAVKFTIGGASCDATRGSTTVGLDHTFVGDLLISLVSPAGTRVQLTNGAGGGGVNLCQTVFDDSAAVAFSTVTAGQNPFTGSFRPQDRLSAFIGEAGNGQWQVKVIDTASDDVGSLSAFSLEIETGDSSAPRSRCRQRWRTARWA